MPNDNKTGSRKKARQERLANEKKRRRILIIVPIIVGILILAAIMVYRSQPVEGTAQYGEQDRGHDVAASFDNEGLPPVGGVHDPRWQNCGIYSEPIGEGPAVHSLEHGAIWITYHPELQRDDVTILQEMVGGRSYLLLSPYPELKSEVVATAWGTQLELDSVSDERLEDFINRYRNSGPEPGAPCTGGLGNPLQ